MPEFLEEWSTAVLKFSSTGFAVQDLSGTFLDVNPAFCLLLGYDREDLMGADYEKVTHPDDLEHAREVLAQFRQGTMNDYSWVKRYLHRDGHSVECRKRLSRLKVHGRGDAIVLQIEGTQEERRLSTERDRMRRRFQQVIDHLPGLVAFWDKDLKNVFANRHYLEFFDWSAEAMVGHHLSEILGPELFAKNKPFFDQAMKGQPVTFERTIRDQSGQDRHTVASYLPSVVDGQVEGISVFVTDNSALKQAIEERLEAQRDLSAILDAATEFSVIATDGEGVIRSFSRGAERLLGYSAADVVGSKTPLLFHDPDEVRAKELELSSEHGFPVRGFEVFIQKAKTGQSERLRWTYLCKEGGRIPVALTVNSIRGGEGEVLGYVGIARDVSAELEAQRRVVEAMETAEAANASKSQFLANMSHEIRTPMNGVIGVTQLLAETPLEESQRELVAMIQSAGQTLLLIINDILDLSKIEAGKMELSEAPFEPRTVFRAVEGILGLKAQEKGIALQVELPPTLPSLVLGDALRLQQVLVNLVGNAVKFTPKGEVRISVRVSAMPPSNRARWDIAVRDTGIGMDEEQMARIFKPFVQAQGTTSRKFGGTGLGLSISKNLVELMGGTLTVESRPYQGSEFRFSIVLETLQATPTPAPPPKSDDVRLDGLRFLVVDDAPLNQFVAKGILKMVGASATSASDGSEAVAILRANPGDIDVILMDVQMPGMNGYEATRLIREELHLQTPIIGLSAGVTPEEKALCLESGMNGFIGKPFQKSQLLEVLQGLSSP